MAYTKTNWNENTPITADKLNKMETGIANGIDKTVNTMEIPITNSDGWQQFRWTKPNCNAISWTRDASARKALEVFNESTPKQLLLLNDDGNLTIAGHLNSQGNLAFSNYGGGGLSSNIHSLALHAATGNGQIMTVGSHNTIYVGNPNTSLALESNGNPIVNIGSNAYHLYHTGNFNPDTKLNAGHFSVNGRDLQIHGKRAMVGFNTADGNYLSLNYDKDFAAGVRIHGLTIIESIETPGNLAFSSLGVGGAGGVRANIYNKALHTNTGNGQMLTTESNRIYVGNPDTNLSLESSSNPNVKVGPNVYQLYHTGNKPTAGEIGALPLSGGTLSGNISVPGESKFYNDAYVDPWHGELCSIKASGHVGIGGSLKVNGKLAFSNIGAGGGLNANIHNLALHNHTGNGQMLTADINRIYVGNPQTHLSIESSSNPIVNVSGNQYHIYHTGNKPAAWDIGAMAANNPSFEGNMVQHGPNGRNWIYHINADAGSLHIAPHNNGNPDWSKQIMFDRNGFIYCNVGRKVPTMDGNNPSHYMFRYGSGLGGANGYITFSY